MKEYEHITPIDAPIPADRQSAKRHYGVHPYFTRRPSNVVRDYIKHFTCKGGRVLDPFGGSGVTAIEAFLENRCGIHNDINPLANFIATGIAKLANGDIGSFRAALAEVRERCERRLSAVEEMSPSEVKATLRRLDLPENVKLPRTSDVEHLYDLFAPRQLAALAILRASVERVENRYARSALRLAWSATVTKLNLTFLSAQGRAASRGGSSIFSIYRYKVAAKPVELPLWSTFEERAANVLAAKEEIDTIITHRKRTDGFTGRFESYQESVADLPSAIESVDYIFTDPPYGGHISYLDLSTLWNAWRESTPSRARYEQEMIVGGELCHSEETYVRRLRDCIRACFAMLKPRRWISVVFQHWSPQYFEAILAGAASAGGDLRAAISQVGDPIWSMHKKKNRQSVLAGEMILTFLKTGRQRRVEPSKDFDFQCHVRHILSGAGDAIYGEYLFNRIIIDAWNAGALSSLQMSKTAFADLMADEGWLYNETCHQWQRGGAVRRVPSQYEFDFG